MQDFPDAILNQLKTGGRAVYPHETGGKTQNLIRSVKFDDNHQETEFLTGVLFVPLLRSYPDE